MPNIRVDFGHTVHDGAEIIFRSPVDCSQITGLIVYYPGADGNITSKEFVLADAHGNNVGDIDHLFAENVVVKVILDVTTSMAFVQNADTNAYLEAQLASKAPASHNHAAADITSGLLPLERGGTGATTAADALANLGALPLAGGTMTGSLNMGTNNITYLADPTGPMQAANKRYVDNSVSTSVSSASNDYHTAHFAKIGKLVICTLLPKTAGTTALYQEDITIPTGCYPAKNTTFTIYTTLAGGGNAEVRAYANGILRVMRADGVSVAESSKTICWITA